jgi:short-subunit dehydrogenase
MRRYGPWAVVVGASDGIGAAFATALAASGLDLVLVARRQALLESLADRLRTEHGVRIRCVATDAATVDGVATIAALAEDIGLLVCNAAYGPVGPFLSRTPAELDAMLDLNCRTAAHLAHAYGTRFTARGRGGIVLLSSMASNQGAALVAHYAATKAYLRVLAEGLWVELAPHGVDVLASCPGPVDTPTYARTGAARSWFVPAPMSAPAVARETLAALGRGPVLIPGRRNRWAAWTLAHLLSRRRQVRLASAGTSAMYPTESRRSAPAAESGE